MKRFILAFSIALAGAAASVVSAASDPMSAVHQFVDGFNKGDLKMAEAVCANEMSIIDEFAPYEWHGAGAFKRWTADFDADAKKNGISDGVVTLGKPVHVDVAGDRAYVVAPVDYAFREKGKPAGEKGSTITIALRQDAGQWQIVAWCWSKR